MQCSRCGGDTKVSESRPSDTHVYRRRKCLNCGYVMYTEEVELTGDDRSKYINACIYRMYRRMGQ